MLLVTLEAHSNFSLVAVSAFIGRLAKRYTAMPLEPLVQQIGNQLKRQSLADLITLKQLISKMSGIEVAQDLTKAQVACLAGGPLMQREAIDLTQIRFPPPPTDDNERMNRGRPKKPPVYDNSKQRLLQALQNSGLTLPILVAIAQAREACVFVATENLGHTKQLGLAFDDVSQQIVVNSASACITNLASHIFLSAITCLINTFDCSSPV